MHSIHQSQPELEHQAYGGFYYYEILEFIDGLTKQGKLQDWI